MKAITIWQPWAEFVAAGVKHNETRSWATKYRGPIAIHAAVKPIRQVVPLLSEKAFGLMVEKLEKASMANGELLTHFNYGEVIATAAVAFVAVKFRLASAAEQTELVLASPADTHAGCLFIPYDHRTDSEARFLDYVIQIDPHAPVGEHISK